MSHKIPYLQWIVALDLFSASLWLFLWLRFYKNPLANPNIADAKSIFLLQILLPLKP